MDIPTEKELQAFALQFDSEITQPLVRVGFDRYNIFDILNIGRQELRHSDFLAFLLNSERSGDIGKQFLRNFLALLAKDVVPTELDFFTMLYGNIENTNVRREVAVKNGRIDILIELEITKEKTQKLIIAIENKVDTGEHDNQLDKYREFLYGEKYMTYKKIMLYLSPDKTLPHDDAWIAIDYEFIYAVLSRVDTENADNTVKTLVHDYMSKIRSEFKMSIDDELKRQATAIYKKNRKVLDFIFDCKPDWVKQTAEILCKSLEQKGATIVIADNNGKLKKSTRKNTANIMFTTKDLADYKNLYFQICVKDMILLFINDSGNRVCRQQWLFDDSQQTATAIENFEKLVLEFDTEQIKSDCEQMLERAFAKGGVISYCLNALKSHC